LFYSFHIISSNVTRTISIPPPGQTCRRRHYVLNPFIHSSVTKLVITIFWKQMNLF